MRHHHTASTLLAAAATTALLVTAGCGLSEDEQTAADSIAGTFAGENPSAADEEGAQCLGEEVVGDVGIDRLQDDNVIDDEFQATTLPEKASTATAEGYADAYFTCLDEDRERENIEAGSPGATEDEIDAYVECVDAISEDDRKARIVAQLTGDADAAVVKEVDEAEAKCVEGLPTPEAPEVPAP